MAPLGQINWWRKVDGTYGADSFTKGGYDTFWGKYISGGGLITF